MQIQFPRIYSQYLIFFPEHVVLFKRTVNVLRVQFVGYTHKVVHIAATFIYNYLLANNISYKLIVHVYLLLIAIKLTSNDISCIATTSL